MYKGTEDFYNTATKMVKVFAHCTNLSQNTMKLAFQILELKEYAAHRKMVNEQAVARHMKEVVYAQERGYLQAVMEEGNAMAHAAMCARDCEMAVELLSQPSYYGQNLLKADGVCTCRLSDLPKVQQAKQFAAIA